MTDTSQNANSMSSSAPAAFPPFFRRRTLGRAPSPPTWACYEQIPPPASDSDECDSAETDSDSQSDSELEDDHDHVYSHPRADTPDVGGEMEMEMEMEMQVAEPPARTVKDQRMDVDGAEHDAGGDDHACGSAGEQCDDDDCEQQLKRQDKGKQRAVEPEPEPLLVEKSPKRRHRKRKHHEAPFVYRPILTIKKSEGFVWNQELFVPSYIKDRYVASTSPPSSGFTNNTPTTSSMPASDFGDNYEIEVVEIRVQGNELEGIIS